MRKVRPDAWIGVDANQGYVPDTLVAAAAGAASTKACRCSSSRAGAATKRELDGVDRTVPIAADESILSLDELEERAHWFDVVNIKLDKCGGLTEGLLMARARARAGPAA